MTGTQPVTLADKQGVALIGLLFCALLLRPLEVAPLQRFLYLHGVPKSGWYEADDPLLAVERAGGERPLFFTPDLRDGDHVRLKKGILLRQDKAMPTQRALNQKIPVNRASLSELESLPGVGPTLARRIQAGRPYRHLQDLDRVKGIGPATLKKLSSRISLE